MLGDQDEINDVYLKVDELFKIRIKTQIKGSGLFFEKFYKATDLITAEEFYSLVINNTVIFFNNTNEFYSEILGIIKDFSKQIEEEVALYESHKKNDLKPDLFSIDNNIEELYQKEYKISLLKNTILKCMNKKI